MINQAGMWGLAAAFWALSPEQITSFDPAVVVGSAFAGCVYLTIGMLKTGYPRQSN